MGCHFLLQGIFLTQWSNSHLLDLQADSLPLSHQGSPGIYREAPVSTGKPYIYKYLNLDRRDVWCFHCKQWTQRFPLFSKLYSPPLPALWAAIPSTQLFWLTLMTPWFPCVYTLNPIHLMTATSKTPPNWPLWTIFTDTILGPSHHHFSLEPPE